MANDTIKGAGDVYEADLYGDLRKSGKSVLPVLDAIDELLAKQTKTTAKFVNVDPKDIKSLDEVNKAIEESNTLFNQRIANDKERLKINKDIIKSEKIDAKTLVDLDLKVQQLTASRNDLLKKEKEANRQRKLGNDEIADAIKLTEEERSELGKLSTELFLNKTQRTELNKENKAIAQEALGLIDLYGQESKRLNQLRKDFKNLILQEGKVTDETEKLAKEIQSLDKKLKGVDATVGQFQRNVGNYEDALGGASDATQEFAEDTDGALSSLEGFALGAVSVGAVLGGLKSSLEGTAEGAENLREASATVEGALSQAKNVAANAVVDFFGFAKSLANGEKEALNLAGNLLKSTSALGLFLDKSEDTGEFFDNTSEASENFSDKVVESAKGLAELEKRIIEFEKSTRPLEIRLAKLNGLIEEQSIIAGDSTRSFDELAGAVLKGQDLQIKRASINVSLAQQELEITQERIRVLSTGAGAGVELLDQETQAIKALIDAENDLKNEVLENEKELRQIKQDRLEIDLDILIDGFDNQKTINERIIANEKETLDTRSALLDKTNQLAEDSFRGQKAVLEELSAAGLNVDDLLLLDATELAKQIRLLEQSEIINTRTLEVVRERRIVIQDLEDAQNDLNESVQEGIDLQTEVESQQKALFAIINKEGKEAREALEKLEEERVSNEIESLLRRQELAKDGSVEALQIQKDLYDALLSQQEDRITKEEKAEDDKVAKDQKREEDAAKRREEIQKAALGLLEKASKESSDRRLKAIDDELSASEKVQDQLRESAAKGVLDSDKSLASEQKKQAELERQAQQEARKQELRTAGFKILSALLEQGKSPQEAIPEVGVLLGALPAVIDSIPTFYQGTNTTVADALGSPHLNTSRDGYVIRADGSEKILNPNQSARTGGMTTDQITNVAESYNKGMLGDLHNYNQPSIDVSSNNNWQSNQQVISKFESLERSNEVNLKRIEKAINDKPALDDVKYDRLLKEMVYYVSDKGTKKKVRSSSKNPSRSIFD